MNGEVNRAVALKAKAGWLRRNSALIPRSLLRGASLNIRMRNESRVMAVKTFFGKKAVKIN